MPPEPVEPAIAKRLVEGRPVDLNPFHDLEFALWKGFGVVLALAILLTGLDSYFAN
jgi:hypothetical protein